MKPAIKKPAAKMAARKSAAKVTHRPTRAKVETADENWARTGEDAKQILAIIRSLKHVL
jgi:hypothetical protein